MRCAPGVPLAKTRNMPSKPLWTLVKVYPTDEVTSRDAEVDPHEVGLSSTDVAEMWASVVRLYETGLHPAIALCVRRRGKVVIDRAIGHARGNAPGDSPDMPKVLATPRTLFNI